MARINIPKACLDPFFRYKRNVLEVRPGKGNTTIITNLDLIASQLDRLIDKLISYFRKALSVNIFLRNGVVLSGTWSTSQLETHLENYIENNILCTVCGNPETDATTHTCKACGLN
jgi:translation initiation factor 2 beta subunit (eIF-2beta)/eIF-5